MVTELVRVLPAKSTVYWDRIICRPWCRVIPNTLQIVYIINPARCRRNMDSRVIDSYAYCMCMVRRSCVRLQCRCLAVRVWLNAANNINDNNKFLYSYTATIKPMISRLLVAFRFSQIANKNLVIVGFHACSLTADTIVYLQVWTCIVYLLFSIRTFHLHRHGSVLHAAEHTIATKRRPVSVEQPHT